MLELYRRIRHRREELGISQDDLAKRLGYKSRSSINKIEKGENDIPQSKIIAFAKALSVTPEYLMGWESVKTNDKVLSDEDQNLLSGYHELSNEGKSLIRNMIEQLTFGRSAGNGNIVNVGNSNFLINGSNNQMNSTVI